MLRDEEGGKEMVEVFADFGKTDDFVPLHAGVVYNKDTTASVLRVRVTLMCHEQRS